MAGETGWVIGGNGGRRAEKGKGGIGGQEGL